MLPTLAHEVPQGEAWIHEIKYDGFRTQLVIDESGVRAFTRNGFNWSDRYPNVLAAAGELDCTRAILDGEMIVQDEQGRSDFAAFQQALAGDPQRIVFMTFDLLHLNRTDLRPLSLTERRKALQELVGCHDPSCCIQYSEHVSTSGAELFSAAERIGLEGIVSKKANSAYRSGRTKAWLKIKCFADAEFVVVGTERSTKGTTALLARETEQGLEYAGGAMLTLRSEDRERFWTCAEELAADRPALPLRKRPGVAWLEPRLHVCARYLKGSDKLRHATVRELLGAPGGAHRRMTRQSTDDAIKSSRKRGIGDDRTAPSRFAHQPRYDRCSGFCGRSSTC